MATKSKPTRKVRRYAEGELVEIGRGYEDSNAGMKEARDASDEEDRIAAEAAATRAAGATAADSEVEPGWSARASTAAKPPIVTKEALAKSGLSLRDYLNQQQGLTRRGSTAAAVPAYKGVSGSGGGRGPTSDELDSYAAKKRQSAISAMDTANIAAATPAGKAARAKQIEAQALEASHPEELLMGVAKAPVSGARALSSLSTREIKELLKNPGNAFSKPGSKANEYVQALLERAPGKLNAPSAEAAREAAKQLAAPTRRLPAPRAISERDWTGGAIGYRKGGAVKKYASGGSVSASSRGDGIASKGKTRGKML